MRLAYADPPYIGQAKKHYKSEEVDHHELIDRLTTFDGWALSASSPSIRVLAPLMSAHVRIAVWVKPFAIFKPNVNPAYTWEPVFFVSARPGRRDIPTVRDWLSCNITLKKGLVGAKPPAFCNWIFQLLGAEPQDEFYDLYPGTNIVTTQWIKFQRAGLPKIELT